MASSPRYRSRGYLNTQEFTVYINVGELHQIEQWVMEYQNIETGGDLFGLWIDDRTAIVQFVLGPGKQCRRSGVSFFQDIEYLRNAGNYLTQRHGLCNIGQWHSHHRLGLTRPSGGDEHTVWGNMPNLGLDRYIVFIATINESYSYYHERRTQVNINPYLFEMERRHRNGVLDGEIESMEGNSPFRLDRSIQNNIKDGAEKINKVKGDQKLKRQHKTENEPTETASKQPKPEVPDSSTNHVNDANTEAQNDDSLSFKADQTGQPNSRQGRNDSIIQGSNESDDQNSAGEQKQVDNDNGKHVDSEILENDKSKELNSLRADSKIQVDSVTQGSHDDKLNSAGEKIQVENENGEHVDSEDSENDQSAQPSSQQDGSKEQVDPITKRSHEGEGKNSAGDNDQVENENGKQDDSDVLEEEQSEQPNGQGDDSKEQDGSITQRSNEGDEQNIVGENDQVANVDSDQSGSVEEQKRGKNPEKIDEQFSISYTQKDNEQNSSDHKLEGKNVDDHDHDNEDDQNGRANVPEGVAESYMKQDMDESIQYKIPTTQGTDQTEFERCEEKEHENHKDQESVNEEESRPEGTDEEMQTDIDLRNAKVNPEKFHVVGSGDQNESRVEKIETDNGHFSSKKESAKTNEETLDMETESIKEPTSVDKMKDEIPQANIALEDITDTSKKLGTQDPVMSIQDLQTQCNDDSERNNMVNDEEIEDKQDLNDHNAYEKVTVDNRENNNAAAKPIEDENPLMLNKQNGNGTEGSSNQSVVTEPKVQDISSLIPPSKIDTNVPTLNINDKPFKVNEELAPDSKKNEEVAVLYSEQPEKNQEKHKSTNLSNFDSNENIENDLISTNLEKKEITHQESPSFDTTRLKEDNTNNNDDIRINEQPSDAIVEESIGEPIRESDITSLVKITDQSEKNPDENIVEHPTIDNKMKTSDDDDSQSLSKNEDLSPKGTDEEMQTHIDHMNANLSPEKSQAIESGYLSETQVENMEIDTEQFSSKNEPTNVDQKTLEMLSANENGDLNRQPAGPQNGRNKKDESNTQGSNEANEQNSAEGEGKNSAGDNNQVENKDGKQDDSDVLEEQSRQPNGQGDDNKEQDGSITQTSNEDVEKNTARENDQFANVDSDQSASDGFEEQKKGKNSEKIDEQFSTSYTQNNNEQNNSDHKLEGKNVDVYDHDNQDDQNGRANVSETDAESYMKQVIDESIQYKITTTQGTEQTEFERSEEKEHENHKDQESVNDEESSPEGTDEEMQTDIDLLNANVNPEKFQVVESGDQNESQVENMETDNAHFSSKNEPAKINEETLEMETENIKEPMSVDKMKDEIPQANIALEDITDTSKKLGTQDPVMSIQDLQTQCDDGSESNNVVNDEETENKQDLNDHNAYKKIKVNSGENNNPAAKPIEDEHPLMLSKQNATKGSSNQSVVTEPISSPISPSKIETNLPTLNINDRHTKTDEELALDSKKIENVAVLHGKQLVENPEKHDSTNLSNSDSNENIGSDLISTNPEKKEVTLQQSPSSVATILKEDTSNDDISISVPPPNAIVEDLSGEPMKETETTFLAKMTDQNEENSHENIVEHPMIGSKMNTSDDKDNLVNNRSQSMHGDLSNENNNNKTSRFISDRLENLDDVDTTIPEEDMTPTSIDGETKHERKNSQGDKDLLELLSEQTVENECETELQSFEGIDPQMHKSATNENQNKDSPSVSEKIEAKNTTEDAFAQKQQQEMEQIERIPDSESKQKKSKMPKKPKRFFRIKKKGNKSEKMKTKRPGRIGTLFNRKKSNKISETEALTISLSRDDVSDKNTVTNKTKDKSMDAIKVLVSNEGDANKKSDKVEKKWKRRLFCN